MARIAMPVADDVEDFEFSVPHDRLEATGHDVVVIGIDPGETFKGKATARVDEGVASSHSDSCDALVIPGGHSPDKLRMNENMLDFVRGFTESDKVVAAICHDPQLLIEADAVEGRTLTSWPSVRKDLENAGADWVDRKVVVDGNLITSRKPEDLGAFCDAIEEKLGGSKAQPTPLGGAAQARLRGRRSPLSPMCPAPRCSPRSPGPLRRP